MKKTNFLPIAVMFALFFMIAFVTNFAGSMGVIVKNQFHAGNALSQLGTFANFIAYACMGIPAGIILRRKGYKFTSLTAVTVGLIGVGIQWVSGYAESFAIYLVGAFIAGFSMCLLNIVVNPMLNTLGGGGAKGNQLLQFGSTLNSVGGTLAPILLGYLIGGNVEAATVADAAPAMMIAMGIFLLAGIIVFFSRIPEPHLDQSQTANQKSQITNTHSPLSFRHFALGALAIFFYVGIEVGIPNMGNLYMSNDPLVGAKIAGTVVGIYWLMMLVGRFVGASIAGKVSSKAMLTTVSLLGTLLLLTIILLPEEWTITFRSVQLPVSMVLMVACGLCTSVMWGAIFNLATEGLGKYTPAASGIFMTLVCGGGILPLIQGWVADIPAVGYVGSYIVPLIGLCYILFYAQWGSKNVNKDIPTD